MRLPDVAARRAHAATWGGGQNITTSTAVVLAVAAPSGCLTADLGVQGGTAGHDGLLDNNDFIAFIDAFFNHTGCP